MKHLSLAKPHLIVMVGIPGSGKSFFAEKFTDTFGAPYISLDRLKNLADGDLQAIVELQLDELLKTNQLIVLDAETATKTDRIAMSKKAREVGYETLFVWVQTDETTARSRKKQLSKDEYDKLLKRFTPLSPAEKSLVISGKHTYASQAKVVLKKLSTPRVEVIKSDTPPARPERPNSRSIPVR